MSIYKRLRFGNVYLLFRKMKIKILPTKKTAPRGGFLPDKFYRTILPAASVPPAADWLAAVPLEA